jgi:hypothetical protein
MTNIDNRFINDIEPDPQFIKRMADKISDCIEDQLSDFVMQIITDYVPADAPEGVDQQAYEDEVIDEVHNPLYERIERIIYHHLLRP